MSNKDEIIAIQNGLIVTLRTEVAELTAKIKTLEVITKVYLPWVPR